MLEGNFSQQRTQGGGDIRRQDMPFISPVAAGSLATVFWHKRSGGIRRIGPGTLGMYQVNVQIPDNAPTGTAVGLAIGVGGATSNPVTIAIQ